MPPKKHALGKALKRSNLREQQQRKQQDLNDKKQREGINVDGKAGNRSVTEVSDLQALVDKAAAENEQFAIEKQYNVVYNKKAVTTVTEMSNEQLEEIRQKYKLVVPRRPEWNKEMSAEELDQLEQKTFMDWKKKLYELQNESKLLVTPYEKNIEFWRQLWRTCEQADLVLQIVDGRDPLFYYSTDLEEYVDELGGKKCGILVNKADLMTDEQRECWLRYFDEHGIRVIFYSALKENKMMEKIVGKEKVGGRRRGKKKGQQFDLEMDEDIEREMMELKEIENEMKMMKKPMGKKQQRRMKEREKEMRMLNKYEDEDEVKEMKEEKENEMKEMKENEMKEMKENEMKEEKKEIKEEIEDEEENDENENDIEDEEDEMYEDDREHVQMDNKHHGSTVLNATELMEELARLVEDIPLGKHKQRKVVGFCGFPNVGKSSTINSLLGTKKVGVTSTPGKTKHFQTLILNDNLMLCDCPGLVFPSFLSSKEEMICSGVLPIDQMQDCIGPIDLVTKRINASILEEYYKFKIPKADDFLHDFIDCFESRSPSQAELFLAGFAKSRRYYTNSRGLFDYHKVARIVLKDYCCGRLVYCKPPPGVTDEQFKSARINESDLID